MVDALLKFAQGVTTAPAGEALIGAIGSFDAEAVTSGNPNYFEFWVIDVPPGSAQPLGLVSAGPSPIVTLLADQSGGVLVKLLAQDALGRQATDYRVFQVPEANTLLIPPFAATAAMLNFAGGTRGWAPIMEDWLRSGFAGAWQNNTGVVSLVGTPTNLIASVTDSISFSAGTTFAVSAFADPDHHSAFTVGPGEFLLLAVNTDPGGADMSMRIINDTMSIGTDTASPSGATTSLAFDGVAGSAILSSYDGSDDFGHADISAVAGSVNITAGHSINLSGFDSVSIGTIGGIYLLSTGASFATTGSIRVGQTFSLVARNTTNDANMSLIDFGVTTANGIKLGSSTASMRIDASAFLVNSPTQTTVGAVGGAAALPATPKRYLKVDLNGEALVIPAYLA